MPTDNITYVLVPQGVYNLVLNALKRDAEEGRKIRGEILAELESESKTLVRIEPGVVQRLVSLAKGAEANYQDRLFKGDAWGQFEQELTEILVRNQATNLATKT